MRVRGRHLEFRNEEFLGKPVELGTVSQLRMESGPAKLGVWERDTQGGEGVCCALTSVWAWMVGLDGEMRRESGWGVA